MKTLKVTYKDNSEEVFEDFIRVVFEDPYYIIKCKKGNYKVHFNDLKGYAELDEN